MPKEAVHYLFTLCVSAEYTPLSITLLTLSINKVSHRCIVSLDAPRLFSLTRSVMITEVLAERLVACSPSLPAHVHPCVCVFLPPIWIIHVRAITKICILLCPWKPIKVRQVVTFSAFSEVWRAWVPLQWIYTQRWTSPCNNIWGELLKASPMEQSAPLISADVQESTAWEQSVVLLGDFWSKFYGCL